MKKWHWKIFIGLIVGLLVWLILIKDWGWWLNFSEVVNRAGLGIGAILAGFSAIPIIRDWQKDRKKQEYKDICTKKFSAQTRDKKKIAIWKQKDGNPIYAIDKTDNIKHHIKPWSTFKELGYPDNGWDRVVSRGELEKLDDGEIIDFS